MFLVFGFPYGLLKEEMTILSRSYKGYIVAGKPFTKFKYQPDCYELSFVCPRGLSGAPLLSLGSDIIDVIIGNEQSEMEVYRRTEQITADRTEVYITSENVDSWNCTAIKRYYEN